MHRRMRTLVSSRRCEVLRYVVIWSTVDFAWCNGRSGRLKNHGFLNLLDADGEDIKIAQVQISPTRTSSFEPGGLLDSGRKSACQLALLAGFLRPTRVMIPLNLALTLTLENLAVEASIRVRLPHDFRAER